MQDLSAFPIIQLQYLKSFVDEHEKAIRATILESEYTYEKRELAHKYEKYLIRFISLLSDASVGDQEAAAIAVANDFYPIKECLVEVKKQKNKLAEAVLV